ncbi:MAB_1171c family putative transporter [Streptomyces buecherae]|uniref:MAB_1171c family putative transporter n=1 Tax=Streptomyces buecherae TaxID=2763006 RepID=UPI00364AD33B
MLDQVALVIVVALVAQAVWRMPSALRGEGGQSALAGALAAFAGAWWVRSETGRNVIDMFGVTDLATLIKHILTIMGICAVLSYVTATYAAAGYPSSARHVRIAALVRRLALGTSLGTIVVLVAVFFFVLDREHPVVNSPYFMTRHAGTVSLAVYMGLVYLYVAAATCVCGYQWAHAARRAHRALRAGLTMMALAMALAVLYATLRAAYGVLLAVHEVSPAFVTAQEATTDTLLHLTFVLWLVGMIAAAATALTARWRAWRELVALYPLWRDLARTVPDVVMYAPVALPGGRLGRWLGSARDCLRADPRLLLERFVTEISDVVRTLSHLVPPDLYARAARVAEREGHTGLRARAVASAYWGRCAMLAVASGAVAHSAPVDAPPSVDDDFDGFVARLVVVADVYRRVDEETVRDLLTATPETHVPHPSTSQARTS